MRTSIAFRCIERSAILLFDSSLGQLQRAAGNAPHDEAPKIADTLHVKQSGRLQLPGAHGITHDRAHIWSVTAARDGNRRHHRWKTKCGAHILVRFPPVATLEVYLSWKAARE